MNFSPSSPRFRRFDRGLLLEACAIAAVLLSTIAVSVLWLRVVPVFQAPDEQAHFDYVYALARAGHPLRAAGNVTVASPTVRNLVGKTHFWRVIFHNAEVNAPDYGSAAYMRRLDESTAQTPRAYYEGPHHAVPTLIGLYPFGGYGMVALVVAVVGGSPLHMFFTARAACVVFAVAGLLFGYLALRELGVKRIVALPLLAAMGFFPETSFISSYVQPDNVALAFTSLALYAAIRLRRRPAERASFALYAVALALLVATKFQFAAAVAIATAPYVILRLLRAMPSAPARAGVVAATFGPSLVSFLIVQWCSRGNASSYLANGALTHNLVHSNEGSYLFTWIGNAFVNYFDYGTGTTATSFWGIFGWLDTRLVIRPEWLAQAFGTCIYWGTWGAVLATVLLVVQNARRILYIGRTRGLATGARLAFGDPLINAYVVFALLMVAIYVSSGNGFGAQGRNWFPFLPSAFALGTVYVPKLLPRRRARWVATAAVLSFFVAFAAAGSYWAIRDVVARYYHPTPGVVSYRLDALNRKAWNMSGSVDECDVVNGQLVVRGWMADMPHHRAASGVAVFVDGRFARWSSYGAQRADVSNAFHDDAYTYTGFGADIPLPRQRGRHAVTFTVVDAAGAASEPFPGQRSIIVP